MAEQLSFHMTEHSRASRAFLERVIRLKQQHWPVSSAENLRWMKENLSPSDKHVTMRWNGREVAYLNLTRRLVRVGGVDIAVTGVGNVCVDQALQRLGLGRLLMGYVNFWLRRGALSGMLLCHDGEVAFYERCGWHKIAPECSCAGEILAVNVMAYNLRADGEVAICFNNGLF